MKIVKEIWIAKSKYNYIFFGGKIKPKITGYGSFNRQYFWSLCTRGWGRNIGTLGMETEEIKRYRIIIEEIPDVGNVE